MRTTRHRTTIGDLRSAIDCLPRQTRAAMLAGVRSNDIIVGAYTDRRGGVCPMLAAHRCGGRTSFLTFARSWDRFTGPKRARRATRRELRILITQLEASLEADVGLDLSGAIADHRRLLAVPPPPAEALDGGDGASRPDGAPSADRQRTQELRDRPGWSWLRPFRRYDDYARALARLAAEPAEPAGTATPALQAEPAPALARR
jgi:hypothetical protein